MTKGDKLTITQVAQKLGVTPKTIMRWERAGKVGSSKRDWRGWRVYDEGEMQRLRAFFETTYDSWKGTPYANAE